jgi:diguanylate cyclase (GGDEF)-like protein
VRLITRNDATLVVGLIAGTIVVFQRPLRFIWNIAGDIQERYNVDLVPALTIFVGVFIFHESRKRLQAKADAIAAAAEAAQARMRSAELERLMTFSRALANALDEAKLQQVLWRFLPAFAGEREFWVLTRKLDRWDALVRDTAGVNRQPVEELESIAERALLPESLSEAGIEGTVDGEAVCFPMLAGETVVGVLGIRGGSTLTHDERKGLAAATGLIAIAVRNVHLFLETKEHGLRDGLTSCFNRTYGLEALELELRRARRMRQPLSILMFDIDHFKTINDRLGHLRGDDVLRAVGAQLTQVTRSTDVRCRYGGDEFLVILPDTPLLGAQHVAESLRKQIGTLAMVAGDHTVAVTASVGVAAATASETGVTALIERADEALYRAKRSGRNRFCVSGSTEPSSLAESELVSVPVGTGQPG